MTGRADPAYLAAVLERAAALLATDPATAERHAREFMSARPRDPRAALIFASARRRQGDARSARAVLESLARLHPGAARTQYELGLTLSALAEDEPAMAALRQAVLLDREFAEAWRALGDLLFREGDVPGAEAAYAQFRRASVRDPRLQPAAEALFRGDLSQAETMLRQHLSTWPRDVIALRLFADTFARAERYAEAEAALLHALEIAPEVDALRFAYADVLFRQQKGAAAVSHVERLLARAPREPAYLNLLAACLTLVGEYDRVLALYERLLGDFPKQPKLWLNYGHTLRTVRRGKDAAEAYRHCIALAPGLGNAYWSLANLKVTAFAPAQIELMRERLRRPDVAEEDRLHFNFALGKALEDAGEYADAFEHFQAGAVIRRTGLNYDPEANTTEMRRSQGVFTTGFFADRAGAGCRSEAPIFIVGLPRSGSTLVEQILASHSAVEGTAELPELGLIAAGLARAGGLHEGYPEILASIPMRELAALGERYIELTRVYRKLGRPRFLDKMPNNFQHLGLIHLILPNARIVDVRRHPLGACFSAFKQHFAQGQAFSYDLTDLGRYYRDYVALIAHFEAVLPGRVHRVIYEDLVQDPEGEVRRLLQYCCVPFEPQCLKFYENDRAVRTVSSEQVRRPIFRDGLERWRPYEPWLGPLKEALGPVLQHWRASTPPPG